MWPLTPRCEVVVASGRPVGLPEEGWSQVAAKVPAGLLGVVRGALRWMPIGLAAALMIPLFLCLDGSTGVRRAAATDGGAAQHSRLGLTVRLEADQLILSWDWKAKPVAAAEKAVLSITDGGRREDTELDLSVLRGKKLAYPPLSNDVSLQFTVGSSEQNNLASEWVRVIAPRGFLRPPSVPVQDDHTRSR
jgi:hypothetical protein